jgi:hypothetical protein
MFISSWRLLLHAQWSDFKSQRQNFTPLIKKRYELYFGCKIGDQDKRWAPRICCVTCVKLHAGLVNGSCKMLFTVQVVWREPKDQSPNCYFCLTNATRITPKSKHIIIVTIISCHQLGLDRPILAYLIVSSKVFQVVFVHLVYNSALFLGILLFISATCHSQFNLYLLGFLLTDSAFNSTKIY